jgi:hypothetical protein
MNSEWARHNGHVLVVSLSSSLEGSGALVEDLQSRMHSIKVRKKPCSSGTTYQDRRHDHN